MNRLERTGSLNEILRRFVSSAQEDLWTALPGQIEAYDATKQTCEVRPTIQITRFKRDGTTELLTMPKLLDVPVMFPSAGGYTLTFPVAVGDEVLVVFASRCIDAWWASGGPQPQASLRMHSLSDGFAILGARNQTRLLNPAPSGNSLQLRSDDGGAIIEIASGHVINVNATNVNVHATGTATVISPSIILKNAGTALKKLVNDTFLTLFDAHVHTSAAPGSPTSVPAVLSQPTNATSVVQAE